MCLTLRAVAVSLLVAIVFGVLVGTALVVLSELSIRLDLDLLTQAVEIGVLASAPYSIPLGIVGGLVVASMLRRSPRGWSRRQWITRGAGYGAAIGGLGPFVVLVYFDLAAAAGIGAIGALAGALCGATMGYWSARVERARLGALTG